MSKFNLSKQKILILAISAVVVIAGSVAAVVLIRNFNKKEDTTTTATVPQYVEETYYVDIPEFVTNENYETVTDPSGNALTTIKKVVKTTKKAVKGNKATTKKSTATTKKTVVSTKAMTPLQSYLNENQLAGYKYDAAGEFYYTDDKDCWQKNCGYNEVYDNLAPAAAMNIDQVRVRFTYGNKDWMIQLWKGQYGWLFVGAETGVYTAPAGSYKGQTGDVNHYNCADKEDWLDIQLDCYWSENNDGHYKKIFTREYGKYWWATGFVKGQLTKYSTPRSELKAKNRITFKSKEMADLFVLELRRCGFKRAVAADQLVDDSYFQNGKDVYLLWTTIYHDAFKDYQESKKATTTTTTKPTTTTTTKAPTTTEKPTTTTTKAATTTTTTATTTTATTTTTTTTTTTQATSTTTSTTQSTQAE